MLRLQASRINRRRDRHSGFFRAVEKRRTRKMCIACIVDCADKPEPCAYT